MGEVVGSELGLETVLGMPERRRHDPCVVDQDIELFRPLLEIGRGFLDTVQRVQVEFQSLGLRRVLDFGLCHDVVDHVLKLGHVAAAEEEMSAGLVHGAGSLDADASGGSGNEDDLVRQLPEQAFVLHHLHRSWARIPGPFIGAVTRSIRLESLLWGTHCEDQQLGNEVGRGNGLVVIAPMDVLRIGEQWQVKPGYIFPIGSSCLSSCPHGLRHSLLTQPRRAEGSVGVKKTNLHFSMRICAARRNLVPRWDASQGAAQSKSDCESDCKSDGP